jgi:hypothetical protein
VCVCVCVCVCVWKLNGWHRKPAVPAHTIPANPSSSSNLSVVVARWLMAWTLFAPLKTTRLPGTDNLIIIKY